MDPLRRRARTPALIALSDRGGGVRSGDERAATRGAPRRRNRDHETDDRHEHLPRRSDAGTRRSGRGPQGRFERGGWALPLFYDEAETYLSQVYQRADGFLFGRRTYEIFAGSWGTWADPGDSLIWTALNTRPKYVASTTLTNPRWAATTVLSGDLAAAIGKLKARPGGELQVHGSGNLIRWLLDNHLVDEITLLTYPVVIGQCTRLFPDTGPDTALDLLDSRPTPTGITIQVYRPTGRPQYATTTPAPTP